MKASTRKDRDRKGRFAPGCAGGPGNPHVRRLGEHRRAIREAVSPDTLRQVVQKLAAQALEGDVAAAKLLLERVEGKPREAETLLDGFDLPPVGDLFGIAAAHKATLEAVAAGKVSVESARKVCGMLDQVVRSRMVADIEQRLRGLERGTNGTGNSRNDRDLEMTLLVDEVLAGTMPADEVRAVRGQLERLRGTLQLIEGDAAAAE